MTIIYPNALRQKSPWQGPCGPRRTSAGIGAALAKSTSVDYRRGRGDMTWSTCTVGPWRSRSTLSASGRPAGQRQLASASFSQQPGQGAGARGPGRRHAAVLRHSPKAAREQKYWSWDNRRGVRAPVHGRRQHPYPPLGTWPPCKGSAKQCIAGMAPEAWGSFASWPSPPFYSKLMRRSTWHAPGVGRLLFTEHC